VFDLGTRANMLGIPNGYFVASSTIAMVKDFVVMCAVILSVLLVSREFGHGTVKSAWVRPLRRTAWYDAKLITACGIITVLFLLVVGMAIAFAGVRFGFEDLMENNYLIHDSKSMAGRMFTTLGLTLWALWAVSVATAALSTLFKNSGAAIAAVVAAGIVLSVFAALKSVGPYIITTYLMFPLVQLVAMTTGVPLPEEWNTLTWRAVVFPGVWMVGAYLIGRWIVSRKEITG